MARSTRILGFSVSPQIAEEYEKLVERRKTTKSELFRQMFDAYRTKLAEEEFYRLQSRMTLQARSKQIFTEKEVEDIVFEDR